MVLRADDRLVNEFLKALEENGQHFLADLLLETGIKSFYNSPETFPGMIDDAYGVDNLWGQVL